MELVLAWHLSSFTANFKIFQVNNFYQTPLPSLSLLAWLSATQQTSPASCKGGVDLYPIDFQYLESVLFAKEKNTVVD